ncbi:MAG: phenylalanine--tRNA ligase beta subunit-related protein [Elusimicrobiota bacterium]
MENRVPDALFVAGVVVARGVKPGPAPAELARLIDELVLRRAAEEFPAPMLKDSVRRLLKRGGFKPSGRNKPASEYLAQAARENRFPRINNLVDVNNLLSLETGLPISLLDLAAFGDGAALRYGKAEEKYVFNSAGQEIDLEGLLCVCSGADLPLGNAVKDSMTGKLKDGTSAVLGVIYAAVDEEAGRAMAAHVERFARLLKEFGGASETETAVLKV